MSGYKLWDCSYSFNVPSNRADERHTEHYIVAARNEAEAVLKGNICLSNNPYYFCGDVKYKVKGLGRRKIKLPKLSLDDKDFEISAKLSNESLEFIVRKK